MASTSPEPEGSSDDDVREACAILAAEGLMNAYGHVSKRLTATTFVISGRVSPLEAAAAPTHVIDIESLRTVEDVKRGVPIEVFGHARIYHHRPDVGAIARIHGDHSNAVSLLGIDLWPVHYLATILQSPAVHFNDPALLTDVAISDLLASRLGRSNAALMRGNGQIVVGPDVISATVRALMLEETARLFCIASQAGVPAQYSPAELEATREVWADPINTNRFWSYFRARLAQGASAV